eukprot:m.293114 g.293114  ORF g.293114 m.293114 type:complete len:172 (+) comp19490_c0_seq6:2236-2751(+)
MLKQPLPLQNTRTRPHNCLFFLLQKNNNRLLRTVGQPAQPAEPAQPAQPAQPLPGGALDGSDRVAARALEHELVHALLVVFDATDPDPVGGLQEWHSFVCNQVVFATPEPIVFAIAAKSDLALDLDNRLVGMNKALSWAQHTFGLSSAKGVGAEEAVEELVRTLCDDTEEL